MKAESYPEISKTLFGDIKSTAFSIHDLQVCRDEISAKLGKVFSYCRREYGIYLPSSTLIFAPCVNGPFKLLTFDFIRQV